MASRTAARSAAEAVTAGVGSGRAAARTRRRERGEHGAAGWSDGPPRHGGAGAAEGRALPAVAAAVWWDAFLDVSAAAMAPEVSANDAGNRANRESVSTTLPDQVSPVRIDLPTTLGPHKVKESLTVESWQWFGSAEAERQTEGFNRRAGMAINTRGTRSARRFPIFQERIMGAKTGFRGSFTALVTPFKNGSRRREGVPRPGRMADRGGHQWPGSGRNHRRKPDAVP